MSSAGPPRPPLSPIDAALAEVSAWKLAGVLAWHASLYALGAVLWRLLVPPWSSHSAGAALPAWLLLALAHAATLPVLLMQRRVLTTLDVPPVHVPRLGWSGKSWPCLFLARCVLRRRRLADVADVAGLCAACVASATACLRLLQPAGSSNGASGDASSREAAAGSQRALLLYAACLGLMYGVGHLIRAKNVLSFPVLQRHRYFRMKQRMRAIARSSLWLASAALLPAAAASAVLLGRPWPGGVAAAAAAWRSGLLVAYSWLLGGHLLEVVFTERVAMAAPDDPDPTPPLLAALQHGNPLVQDWSLLDLAAVAEGASGCSARRAALFDDETGASGWVPLSRYCLTELRDFVGVMAAALPSLAGAAASGAGVRWNSLQLSAAGGRTASAAQDLALWHLQARYSRLVAAMRALSGLAAAGLSCDRFGLLQLASPGLSDVLVSLLGVVAVLQAFVKNTSAIPSRPASQAARLMAQLTARGSASSSGAATQHHVDAAAWALLDTAKTCTYRLTATYGGVLAGVVAQAKPLVGSTGEAQALLAAFLDGSQ